MTIIIRSERQAWEEIKKRAAAGQRRGASVESLRALFIECDAIADTMLAQLFEGVHKNPGKPRTVVNPTGLRFSGTHLVRTREVGKKKWLFMAPGGRVTPLRVRASVFDLKTAENFAIDINTENPGEWEAEAVPL